MLKRYDLPIQNFKKNVHILFNVYTKKKVMKQVENALEYFDSKSNFQDFLCLF